MSYLGSKGAQGVWQRIAREVPTCDVLVSPFAGQCALLRMITPPRVRVAMDLDPDAVQWWQANEPDVIALQRDSIAWLEDVALHVMGLVAASCVSNRGDDGDYFASRMGLSQSELRGLCNDGRVITSAGGQIIQPLPFTTLNREQIMERVGVSVGRPDASVAPAASPLPAGLPSVKDLIQHADRIVIYLDPPYVLSTRSHEDSVYHCDMTDADHVRLLRAIRWLPCCVLISGYQSDLYFELLSDWRRIEFTGQTRGGPRQEVLWSNCPTPAVPQDQRHVGTNYREREKLAKRDRRLRAKVLRMPLAERLRLLNAIAGTIPPELAGTDPAVLPRGATSATAESGEVRAAVSRTDNPVRLDSSDGQDCPSYKVTTPAESRIDESQISPLPKGGAGGGTNQASAHPPLTPPSQGGEPCDRPGASDTPASHQARAPHAAGGVLSLYSGLDLLGEAFREQGFTVDSAGDIQWVKPIQNYRGRLNSHEGIIAGVPCQTWSQADPNRVPKSQVDFSAASTHEGVITIREFLRVVDEVQPEWWLAECVPGVPDIIASGYHVQRFNLTDTECGGKQWRLRSIQFGSRDRDPTIIRPSRHIGIAPTEPAVLASRCRGDESAFERRCRAMGLDHVPDLSAFTKSARFRLVGNGVPMAMGRVLAQAVTLRTPMTESDCICGCGQVRAENSRYSAATNATCRQRMKRRRSGRFVVELIDQPRRETA